MVSEEYIFRYDLAQLDFRQFRQLLMLRSGGIAIVVYAVSLVVTLVTTRLDDKISLYSHNATLFEQMDQQVNLTYCTL